MTGGFAALPSSPNASSSSRFIGTARVLGPPLTHLPTLTISLLGVQIFWSVEMSYASPYLISLGLTSSTVTLVFLAGPLSGLIVQPLVGALADASTSRFGRRRPFILLGCVLCVLGMLLLGYTRAVAGVFTTAGGAAHGRLTVALAVLSIFVLDFSINAGAPRSCLEYLAIMLIQLRAVQAVDRALLVDTLPPAQQAAGNAWAASMLGAGSVVGFFVCVRLSLLPPPTLTQLAQRQPPPNDPPPLPRRLLRARSPLRPRLPPPPRHPRLDRLLRPRARPPPPQSRRRASGEQEERERRRADEGAARDIRECARAAEGY